MTVTRASVPGTPVRPAPLPVKVPFRVTSLWPSWTKVAGSCPSGTVPVSWVAATGPLTAVAVVAVFALSATSAVAARIA